MQYSLRSFLCAGGYGQHGGGGGYGAPGGGYGGAPPYGGGYPPAAPYAQVLIQFQVMHIWPAVLQSTCVMLPSSLLHDAVGFCTMLPDLVRNASDQRPVSGCRTMCWVCTLLVRD